MACSFCGRRTVLLFCTVRRFFCTQACLEDAEYLEILAGKMAGVVPKEKIVELYKRF